MKRSKYSFHDFSVKHTPSATLMIIHLCAKFGSGGEDVLVYLNSVLKNFTTQMRTATVTGNVCGDRRPKYWI